MNKVESIHDRIVMKTEAKSSTVLFAEGLKVVGLGFMAGQISVPDDFDRIGSEEIEVFFGAPE